MPFSSFTLSSDDPLVCSRECNNYGVLLSGEGHLEEAIGWYKQSIEYDANNLIAYYNLSDAYRRTDRFTLASIGYQHVLEVDPTFFRAKYGLCLCFLARFYQTFSQLNQAREAYTQHLNELIELVDELDEKAQWEAASSVGLLHPFFLSYQGQNDFLLQKRLGQMLHRLMKKRYPQFSDTLKMPPLGEKERIRVGFVSRYFYDSSVWKIPLGGWVLGIDENRFETFGYSVTTHQDASTQQAKEKLDHFTQELDFEKMAQQIQNDRLHVLIFADIGMETLTTRLATLRLSPIQCTGLGHPVTTGLPTIDFFLSSEWMEPPSSEKHYSEQLVKLGNLGVHYRPYAFEPEKRDWQALGIREKAVKYLCCQSLSKYLPQHDGIWVEIAKKVPQAQFIFLARPAVIASHFQERLEKAFQKQGLKGSDHLLFLPLVKVEQFADLCQSCDLFLDSFEWSGFNTSMEALQRGLPIITLPGALARGRHTSAILKMMGLDELIASDFDRYIQLAADLGLDVEARQILRKRIEEQFATICYDQVSLRDLEAFMEKEVQARLSIV